MQTNPTRKFTFEFQFIIACFPETSTSFNNKSLGETLPRVNGSLEEFADCTEQRIPREGPETTSRERQLPALLTERYDYMLYKINL